MQRRAFVATVILVLGLPLITFYLVNRITSASHLSDVKSCQKRNGLRDAIVSFVDSTLERSVANARATVASPTATAEQKQVAQSNLDQLAQVVISEHTKLAHEDCSSV